MSNRQADTVSRVSSPKVNERSMLALSPMLKERSTPASSPMKVREGLSLLHTHTHMRTVQTYTNKHVNTHTSIHVNTQTWRHTHKHIM